MGKTTLTNHVYQAVMGIVLFFYMLPTIINMAYTFHKEAKNQK